MASDIKFRPATPERVDFVAKRMRHDDSLSMSRGGIPKSNQVEYVKRHTAGAIDAAVVEIGGIPAAVICFSEIGLLDESVRVSFLATDLAEKHPLAFGRLSRLTMCNAAARWASIKTFADMHRPVAVNWLRWLGFTESAGTVPSMAEHGFCDFILRRNEQCLS